MEWNTFLNTDETPCDQAQVVDCIRTSPQRLGRGTRRCRAVLEREEVLIRRDREVLDVAVLPVVSVHGWIGWRVFSEVSGGPIAGVHPTTPRRVAREDRAHGRERHALAEEHDRGAPRAVLVAEHEIMDHRCHAVDGV